MYDGIIQHNIYIYIYILQANEKGELKGVKVVAKALLSHLLLLDDVLLFGMGKVEEWRHFNKLLSFFCETSRMLININKFLILGNE